MKIAICGSLAFTYEIQSLAEELQKIGIEAFIPITSKKIVRGELSLEEIKEEKAKGKPSERKIKYDAMRAYCDVIRNCDGILVANYDKNGIENYIGGNAFLEMGFAHITHKKIYLLNDIPDMIYRDEIEAMQPIILHGDLLALK